MLRRFAAPLLLALSLLWPLVARSADAPNEPARVIAGVFVNGLQDVSFKDSKYVIDFYVWFRWKPDSMPADFKPLEAFELINGRIDNKSSIVEKTIGGEQYASARVLATINEVWDLRRFPFDQHRPRVHIENSAADATAMVFVADRDNSRLGDEIKLSGWKVSNFGVEVATQVYKSNYGDVSLPTNAESSYSRLTFAMDIERDGNGIAFKILTIVIVSTLVAFVAFLIRPIDLDPRFGLGIGALFAIAASWFIVSSLIPDSAVLTLADQIHVIAMAMVFASVVVSARILWHAEAGREQRADKLDRACVAIFPIVFIGACIAAGLLAR
jgi:hypothetical protein